LVWKGQQQDVPSSVPGGADGGKLYQRFVTVESWKLKKCGWLRRKMALYARMIPSDDLVAYPKRGGRGFSGDQDY
jgi:hypothetical protein